MQCHDGAVCIHVHALPSTLTPLRAQHEHSIVQCMLFCYRPSLCSVHLQYAYDALARRADQCAEFPEGAIAAGWHERRDPKTGRPTLGRFTICDLTREFSRDLETLVHEFMHILVRGAMHACNAAAMSACVLHRVH